ncbi:MAG: single-stranded DNA-binding protein [Bacteroidetes bacterium]|nr:MAG: single-stranded DNA-binding protein [Bacteroidota bacterium]
MNNLRNRVQLIGNIGKEPEVKTFDSGKTKASFSLATSESYTDSDGKKVTDTQWHQIVAWGNTANYIESYLDKGNRIAVDGKLVHRSYNDKDGTTKYITEVLVSEVLLLTNKATAV